MKAACVILTVIIAVAIIAICLMVKFATDITVEEKRRDFPGETVHRFNKNMGVITLKEKTSSNMTVRFPYVAAVTRNSSSSWSFACFGSVILVKWIVTSAHCRRPGASHRVLIYHDFNRNQSHTYAILFWRVHEKFNMSNPTPKYDIAIAKMNMEKHGYSAKPSIFVNRPVNLTVDGSVWKTVSSMDRKVFLTNDMEKFSFDIAPNEKCYENYGVELDDSLLCVDLSDYEDCFIHEFGPLYYLDKLVGVLAVKPKDCDVKVAIFTNVSFYTNWLLRSTFTTAYG